MTGGLQQPNAVTGSYCKEEKEVSQLIHSSILPRLRSPLCRLAVLAAAALSLSAQESPQSGTEDKRILWFFTNHRTTDDSGALPKLTPRGKLGIAFGDATDRAIFLQTAFISGLGQATNANPSFGQGMEGYARRFGTTYADFAVENMMTEGIFPTLLHQDPRYFRRREGTGRSRLGYAIEVVGGATSVAISNTYYPDGRNVADNMGRYAVQLGFDAASNVLKEFWPDLKRKLPRRLVQR